MKNILRIIVVASLALVATFAQTPQPVNVQKTSGTNAITGDIVVPTGRSITATGSGSIVATSLSGGTALTNTYVGFGNATNVLTGESAFTYASAGNLTVSTSGKGLALNGNAAITSTAGAITVAGGTSGTFVFGATGVAAFSGAVSATNFTGTFAGNTFTTGTGTLTLAASKTLTANDNITMASDGTGTRTLNIAAGGTLGSNAFTSTGYLPLTGGTLTGNLLFTDNTYDIGASGATRPRTGYFGTSVVAPNFVGSFAGNTFTTGTGVLTIAAAKTLTASNTLTLAGTDSTVMTFPSTSATIARTDAANSFTGVQTTLGTSTHKFGATANATIGVSADATSANLNIIAPQGTGTVTIATGNNVTALTLGSDQSGAAVAPWTWTRAGIATTSTDALVLNNSTAATSGVAVQYSPRTRYVSQVWNTTATAANNFMEAIQEVRPTSAATPTGLMAWAFRLSTAQTGSYTDAMTLSDTGVLTLSGTSKGIYVPNGASQLTTLRVSNVNSNDNSVTAFTVANTTGRVAFAENITAAAITASGTIGSSGFARVTGDVTNATATMSNLTNLSVTVAAGVHYIGTVTVFANDSTGADGLAFDLGGGACTFTDLEFGFTAQPTGSTLGTVTSTTSTTAITLTVVSTSDAVYTISFGFTCNAGGTFIPRFAQNSHSAGTATVRKNSGINLVVSGN